MTADAAMATPPPVIDAPPTGVWGAIRRFFKGLLHGEYGTVRVVIGIAIIWTIFAAKNPHFLTAENLTNLTLQVASVATISIGVVLVLLLGEIDLSVGSVSGLGAAVMGVLNVHHGWGAVPSITVALLVGLGVGFVHGAVITRFNVPPFVTTLAGYLGWQGAMLYVLGSTGSVNINNKGIEDLAQRFFSAGTGWTIAGVVVALYAGGTFAQRIIRVRGGLVAPSLVSTFLRVVLVAAVIVAAMAVFQQDRGLPMAVAIVVGLAAVMQWAIRRTRWGRQVFAVGGNEEAARRAGMPVRTIKLSVFMLASLFAAWGGILEASRLFSVSQTAGGSNTLLNAIAGPVIAGTSLFGGRGSIWSALLGAIVIGSISNGMDLLALDSSVKYMITGGVLLLAVTIDSLAKRNQIIRR